MDSFCSTPVLDALVGQLLEEKVSGLKGWGVGTQRNLTFPPTQAPLRGGNVEEAPSRS